MMRVVLTPRPVSLYSLFHMKQRDTDKVDLWLTNSFLLPLTVLNVSLPPRLQGAMKVRNKFKRNSSDHRDHSCHFSLCRKNWLSQVQSVIFSFSVSSSITPNITHFTFKCATEASAAPCLPGDELQRPADASPGLLARPVTAAAQQDSAHQPAVQPEPAHQLRHCPHRPHVLPPDSLQGKNSIGSLTTRTAVSICELDVFTLATSVSRGRLCLRRSERAGSPALSGCLNQVSRRSESHRSKQQQQQQQVANFLRICHTLQVALNGSVPSSQTSSPHLGRWTANWLRSSALAGRAAKTSCPAGHSQDAILVQKFCFT